MHKSDRLGFGIIVGAGVLIGGGYLLFRIFGDSYLLALLMLAGLIIMMGLIAKFFMDYKK